MDPIAHLYRIINAALLILKIIINHFLLNKQAKIAKVTTILTNESQIDNDFFGIKNVEFLYISPN